MTYLVREGLRISVLIAFCLFGLANQTLAGSVDCTNSTTLPSERAVCTNEPREIHPDFKGLDLIAAFPELRSGPLAPGSFSRVKIFEDQAGEVLLRLLIVEPGDASRGERVLKSRTYDIDVFAGSIVVSDANKAPDESRWKEKKYYESISGKIKLNESNFMYVDTPYLMPDCINPIQNRMVIYQDDKKVFEQELWLISKLSFRDGFELGGAGCSPPVPIKNSKVLAYGDVAFYQLRDGTFFVFSPQNLTDILRAGRDLKVSYKSENVRVFNKKEWSEIISSKEVSGIDGDQLNVLNLQGVLLKRFH